MRTVLYLVRHGATEANLARPYRLQGQKRDDPLATVGVGQAEATRDLLAGRPFAAMYCSPLQRAVQTAQIIAAPHGFTPHPVAELTECDVGRWEGLDWDTIRRTDVEAYREYMADPGSAPYPGGENFTEVFARAGPAIDRIVADHAGHVVLVVSHHVVIRTYLAASLGLSVGKARHVSVENCGVSIVEVDDGSKSVSTLNLVSHLARAAA